MTFSKNQSVLLTKVSQQNPGPLPERYWCRGVLRAPIELGKGITMLRTARAGRDPGEPEAVECVGLYVSTPVKEMTAETDQSVLCRTENSVWRVTLLPVSA